MPRRLGRSGELRRGLPMRASGVAVQCSARLQRRLLRLDVCEALCSHVCLRALFVIAVGTVGCRAAR